MRYTDNALNILAAKSFKGIGRAWIIKNLKGNESVEKIISLLNNNSKQDTLLTINDFEFQKTQIKNQISILENNCDGIVAIGDDDFPRHRGNVKESEQPIFLFYKGDLRLLDIHNNNITVIGLLNPDETIEIREKKIVSEIVKRGLTIVSGLAYGCDSIAHKQALNGGKTIAILPSSLNNIMPARNKNLASEIVHEGGLLITEYFDEHKSANDLSSRYKERDRLQALFCDTIILAASYAPDSAERWKIFGQKLDSGARLAMGFAKDYNIPQAVMYDQTMDLNNPMFDLNRQLIDKQKDIVVLTQKTLEEMINKLKSKKIRSNETPYQTNLFG
ncbi:DNA-processing protein DprA [Elizabethkingia anophelis]|uniref:DNA-binding protein n=1 Tax=Elizabethkingia anophelis TaxID=1117645 RepID=A0AAU8USY8_9FLAO|nr:DNA-processing protein DprA [Elizabethkingia anophelis]AQX00107.1 DNA-binding protein [Elizabethkingia anophelis]MCT3646695.1 DNA-processing protein DprA [Elizabethkingia anophelis]MCT3694454.1 DNA-processing protein DprA [Elizabethkingia anophelis]MCT3857681.1 DNA-processing protein DprA [Elizabethkingia anophelis]MCT3910992.1 DNA-processing protein DprA [Elizabethkingia anophelis]